jgi:hypothetical protein
MISSRVKTKQKLKLQAGRGSQVRRVRRVIPGGEICQGQRGKAEYDKYDVFAESSLGEKFAEVNKGKAEYESLEKRQRKDNQFRSTFEVLEAVNIVKKA